MCQEHWTVEIVVSAGVLVSDTLLPSSGVFRNSHREMEVLVLKYEKAAKSNLPLHINRDKLQLSHCILARFFLKLKYFYLFGTINFWRVKPNLISDENIFIHIPHTHIFLWSVFCWKDSNEYTKPQWNNDLFKKNVLVGRLWSLKHLNSLGNLQRQT